MGGAAVGARPMPELADRRETRGWCCYAWANHAWVTTVSTVLIGPWLLALVTRHMSARAVLVRVGPVHLRAESYPSLVVTAAALLQLLALPVFGAAADGAASRRRWLAVCCALGSTVAVLLATTSGSDYVYAGVLFLVGTAVFGASDLVYNSYLPRLAGPGGRDRLSSAGFAYGYLGGGLLLAVDLALVEAHGQLGIGKASAVRVCFVSAGLWWAVFGAWSLRSLRSPRSLPPGGVPGHAHPDRGGRRPRLRDGLRVVAGMRQTRRYLVAFLLFSDAISAVISLSSLFLTHQLFANSASRAAAFLFELILLVQVVAMLGSLAFGRVAGRFGAKRTLLASLLVWCLIVTYTYFEVTSKAQAVGVGVAIGVVLGGSQALARSLYAQLVPAGYEAMFFGLYEVANQGTSWIAPLLFTVVLDVTGSFRQAILSLTVLFVAGAAVLLRTDTDAAAREGYALGLR